MGHTLNTMSREQTYLVIAVIVLLYLVTCEKEMICALKKTVMGAVEGGKDAAVEAKADMDSKGGFSSDDNYEIVQDPLDKGENFLNISEERDTWEPSTAEFERLGSDTIYKTYAEDLKANVDQAIIESHNEYIQDTNFLATVGASHASENDHFTPAVKHVGAVRPSMYQSWGAERTSRVSQSETPEQVSEYQGYSKNRGFL